MAKIFIIEFKGGTLEQYDKVTAAMHLTDKTPPGCLFHVGGAYDGGLRLVDVWESQEVFDKWANESIGPLSHDAGMSMPTVTSWPMHRMLTPSEK